MSRTTRRDYTGSKRFDYTCRNHGSCGYCSSGRQFASKRRAPAPQEASMKMIISGLRGYRRHFTIERSHNGRFDLTDSSGKVGTFTNMVDVRQAAEATTAAIAYNEYVEGRNR